MQQSRSLPQSPTHTEDQSERYSASTALLAPVPVEGGEGLQQTAGFVEESLLSMCQEQLAFRGPDHFLLHSLWRSVYIVSLTDIRLLEQAVGKDGDLSPASSGVHPEAYAFRWAASLDAQRAILHGVLLLRGIESVPIRAVSPIHVSSSLYHAAMAWYFYLRFSPPNRAYAQLRADEFREFVCFGIDPGALMLEAHDSKQSRPSVQDSTVLSGLVDMLNCIGFWGLSRSLASLILFLATESTVNTDQL